jgi:hypothetical protein
LSGTTLAGTYFPGSARDDLGDSIVDKFHGGRSSTPTKNGCLNSVDVHKKTVQRPEKGNPKRLIFSDLPTIAAEQGKIAINVKG